MPTTANTTNQPSPFVPALSFVASSNTRGDPKPQRTDGTAAGLGFVAATRGDNDETTTTTTATRPSPFVPALSFVASSKNRDDAESKPIDGSKEDAAASQGGGLGFVAATQTTDDNNNQEETAKIVVNDEEKEEEEEERRIRKEQQEADDRFRELLEKAKSRNQRTRPGRTPAAPPPASSSATDEGLGAAGLGLPSSFGGGLGLGASHHDDRRGRPAAGVAKDPTVATWERHTKGFGSKLLAKMGWKGSGGLGSNRRKFRGEATAEANADATAGGPATASSDAATAASASAKKGISRPVEVVVRPTNMGLGFGNFKEASRLKANRRIEAEVRGIDYDAQVAKEKAEARRKRRKRNRDRFGTEDGYGMSSDDDDDDDDIGGEGDGVTATGSSAIPSTEDLLSHQSWKASRRGQKRGKRKRNALPEVIPYEELLARQKEQTGGGGAGGDAAPVIIDMRGPPSGTQPKPGGAVVVPLGEELLYNLSFLTGTYGSKLHSAFHHQETSVRRTLSGLSARIEEAESRLRDLSVRRGKLADARAIVETVRTMTPAPAAASDRAAVVRGLVTDLRDVFTADERKELRFATVLAPALLGPTMGAALEGWNPLGVAAGRRDETRDRSVVDSFFFFSDDGDNDDRSEESRAVCESMVRTMLVPKLRADTESQTSPVWDPVADPYALLDLYEYLRTKALAFDEASEPMPTPSAIDRGNGGDDDDDNPNQIFPSSMDDAEKDDDASTKSSRLAEHIRTELIIEALYPKLHAAVASWKPTLLLQQQRQPHTTTPEKEEQLRDPLHAWILPWLPHIDHPGLLPVLLKDCKRGLRSSLTALQRGIPSAFGSLSSHEATDRRFVRAVLGLLRPWVGVYDSKSLQALVSDDRAVLPRLERLLAASSSSGGGGGDDLRLLFELHGRHLLSDMDFLGFVEGPVLTTWAETVHADLREGCGNERGGGGDAVLTAAVESYRDRKIRVMVNPRVDDGDTNNTQKTSINYSKSLALVRNDEYICRIFYSVARMIQIYREGSGDDSRALELDRLRPEVSGFYAIRARRALEHQRGIGEEFAAMESRSEAESRARIRLHRQRNRGDAPEATFREVVEAFAVDRGVAFRPKPGASSRRQDGKQIYLFGDRSIYLEGDVVFCHDGGTWKPVSLDKLGGMVSSG